MNTQTKDTKLLYQLLNRIEDLYIDGNTVSDPELKHFENLPIPQMDENYNYRSAQNITYEIDIIQEQRTERYKIQQLRKFKR